MAFSALAAEAAVEQREWTGRTMGTTYAVKIAGAELDEASLGKLRAAVEQRLDEINRQMSHYRPDSELSQFNRHTSSVPFKVSAEFARVVRQSLELNQQSGGAFDPTLGWLINLWGFGETGKSGQVPSDAQIADCMRKCGAAHLRVTDRDELQKDLPELRLNLSAVAKGYGVDEVAKLIRAQGITNVLVRICGEVMAWGHNAKGQPWQVGIERPRYDVPPGADVGAVVNVSDRAVSTSGDSYNYFEDETGQVYSHILNPLNGRPLRHKLASVTVLAPNSTTADGVATTLFVLGPEEGLKWVEKRPDLAALFIVRLGADRFEFKPSARFPTLK